ncbi:MAG: GNVR domain-containing protein, partial [Campylobacterota bacterium]|nr:GNVR domain-containing protein [Campylobacterota bacterium]
VIFPQLKRDLLKLTTVDLIELEERKSLIKLSLQPHNFKNTKVIGKIMISDYPIKPKKRLIVVVAFVTGLILSIFLVFFMEFIRGAKEEDAKSSN